MPSHPHYCWLETPSFVGVYTSCCWYILLYSHMKNHRIPVGFFWFNPSWWLSPGVFFRGGKTHGFSVDVRWKINRSWWSIVYPSFLCQLSRFSVYYPIFPYYIHIIPMLYPCYTHMISPFFITVRRSLQVEDEGGDWHWRSLSYRSSQDGASSPGEIEASEG